MRTSLVALMIAATLCALPAAAFAQTVTNTTTGGASQSAPTTTVITFGGAPGSVAPAAPGATVVAAGGGAGLGGLLAMPGFYAAPNNFSQPYKPDTFLNGPKFLPDVMTLEQAADCRDGKTKWYGGHQEEATSITLYYAGLSQMPTATVNMSNYVGTATATGADLPFLPVLCEAAYKAMKRGVNVAMVNSTIRPKNTMFGIGFGSSGGGSGVPDVKSINPYSFAGVLGFGTGWSSAKVEGEVLVELTGLRGGLPVKTSQVLVYVPGPAGVAGPAGPPGPAGERGLTGEQGPVGPFVVWRWTKFKDFLFDFDKSDILPSETDKAAEIAAYMKGNPSAVVGIDGYADPRGTDPYNLALSQRRVDVIRDALIKAGVPNFKIQTGAFGTERRNCQAATEACWQRNRRVEVLISTGN